MGCRGSEVQVLSPRPETKCRNQQWLRHFLFHDSVGHVTRAKRLSRPVFLGQLTTGLPVEEPSWMLAETVLSFPLARWIMNFGVGNVPDFQGGVGSPPYQRRLLYASYSPPRLNKKRAGSDVPPSESGSHGRTWACSPQRPLGRRTASRILRHDDNKVFLSFLRAVS